jgi:cardiolipin synthase
LLAQSEFPGHEVLGFVAFWGVVIGCLFHVTVGIQYAVIIIREGRINHP